MQGSQKKVSASELLGISTLIVGEVGSGKTALTAKILDDLVDLGYAQEITVIDIGPDKLGVGGKLSNYSKRIGEIRLLEPKGLRAPRLEGKNAEEVIRFAEENKRKIEPLFLSFLDSPTNILVINDLSIYLQAGPVETIFSLMEMARTFLANSYYGRRLSEDYGSGITKKEMEAVNSLLKKVDKVIYLQ